MFLWLIGVSLLLPACAAIADRWSSSFVSDRFVNYNLSFVYLISHRSCRLVVSRT